MSLRGVYRILLVGILVIALSGTVWAAASYPIIVEIAADADIKQVAHDLHAKVLDRLPEARTYLLSVSSLSPSAYLTPGIIHLEPDVTATVGKLRLGVLSTRGTVEDWYRKQPALKLIQVDAAQAYSTGAGVVIADINSLVDYSHPALLGHLTGGYDFVSGRPSEANLNQSEATFLDQSSAGFLDQSSSAFLDQSTSSFLDQSDATFLDQSSSSFLDAANPAHGHGTLVAGIIAAIAIATVTRYFIIRPLFESSKPHINLRFWEQFLEKAMSHPKMPLKQRE